MDRVVVVGAGATGRELARRLAVIHDVVLIDPRPERLDGLGVVHPGAEWDSTSTVGRGLRLVTGDPSSRLQLERLLDPTRRCAIVTVTSSDEVNLEVCRLARVAGFDPVIGIQRDPDKAHLYREERVTVLDRAAIVADQIEQSLRHKGAIVPSGVGLGRGELLEIRLVANSPILHTPLRNLALESWRIAAVFREDQLIVPTGDTTLEVDDRVLLVGDPTVLPGVSEFLRLGLPQFPRPYGASVVTWEAEGGDDALAAEATWLADATGSDRRARVVGGRSPAPASPESVPVTALAEEAPDVPTVVAAACAQRPGVVVVRARRRTAVARLLGRRGADARLCDELPVPVLFGRGNVPYRRILVPTSGSIPAYRATELGIDVTRKLGATLRALHVELPPHVAGTADPDVPGQLQLVRRMFELYDLPAHIDTAQGNPIRAIVHASRDADLIVVARRHRRRDTFWKPDIAMRVARLAHCSVLVLTLHTGA